MSNLNILRKVRTTVSTQTADLLVLLQAVLLNAIKTDGLAMDIELNIALLVPVMFLM